MESSSISGSMGKLLSPGTDFQLLVKQEDGSKTSEGDHDHSTVVHLACSSEVRRGFLCTSVECSVHNAVTYGINSEVSSLPTVRRVTVWHPGSGFLCRPEKVCCSKWKLVRGCQMRAKGQSEFTMDPGFLWFSHLPIVFLVF